MTIDDTDGSIYFTGSAAATIKMGSSTISNTGGYSKTFILKLFSNTTLAWVSKRSELGLGSRESAWGWACVQTDDGCQRPPTSGSKVSVEGSSEVGLGEMWGERGSGR